MEIKATLEKPYTETQRMDFIVEENHINGYEIRETKEELQAWGLTAKEEQEKEEERILQLSLTKRDLLLALYDDKGLTPDQLKANLNDRAKIEFDYADKYYRFNPLIDSVGTSLGYTKEQLDYLFEHKEFEKGV